MIEKILKAKHWQLFLLMFGVPMLSQFIIIGTMIAFIVTGKEPSKSLIIPFMILYPLVIIVYITAFFSWFWAIVVGLQNKIPETIKLKLIRFKIFFVIPILYITVFSILVVVAIGLSISGSIKPDPQLLPLLMAILLPVHLFSMFCIFHSLYFAAKTFKTAELQKEVKFSDFAAEFLMIWFYPIGIWILQPKINQMMEDTSGDKEIAYEQQP